MQRETVPVSPAPISKRLAILLAIVFLTIASFNIYSLPLYPPPSCDEVSAGSIATSFLEQGKFGWSVFTQGDYIGRDVNLFRHGRLYEAGVIAIFGLFGASWVAGRVYSLLGGLVATLLVYIVGSRLYDRRTGLLTALVFGTSIITFLTSHLIRPDIWLAVLNLATLFAVYKAILSPGSRWSLSAGLLAIASFDIHGHGLTVILAATTVVILEIGWRQRNWRSVAVFISGLFIGTIIWFSLHLWPSPQIAFAQFGDALGYTSIPGGDSSSDRLFRSILTSGRFLFDVYWGNTRWPGLLEGSLALAGIVVALLRRGQADRIVAIWIGVSFATFVLLFSQRFVNYYVLWSPLLILLGLSAIDFMVVHLPESFRQAYWIQYSGIIVGITLAAANLAGTLWLTYRYRDNNFLSLSQSVQTAVPKGARVLADPIWWWALRQDHIFISDEYFLYPLPPFNPSSANAKEAIAYLKPDIILLDSATSCTDQGGPGYAELQAYAASSCTLVNTLNGPWVSDPGRASTILGQTTNIYSCTQP